MPENRNVSFRSGPLRLEGVLHLPDETAAPVIVVCHPHPSYGGDMHNNVVGAICDVALGNGIAALRFNFRGTGQSEGKYDNGIGEQDDVRAAVAYLGTLEEVDGQRIALAGYSFGAAVALRAAASVADLRTFSGISLPTMMPLEGVTLACPSIFVSGDADEYSDARELTALVKGLGAGAELRLLPGLGHFWFGVEHELEKLIAPFLQTNLVGMRTA